MSPLRKVFSDKINKIFQKLRFRSGHIIYTLNFIVVMLIIKINITTIYILFTTQYFRHLILQ